MINVYYVVSLTLYVVLFSLTLSTRSVLSLTLSAHPTPRSA